MMSLESGVSPVLVHTTSNRGMTPEEWAELLLSKIIHIANSAPPAIREQAQAFKDQLRPVLVYYLRQAALSDRTTIENHLRAAGHGDLAETIRRL